MQVPEVNPEIVLKSEKGLTLQMVVPEMMKLDDETLV